MPNIRVGIVAIESSSDQLGAQLIRELQRRFANLQCIGCGGDAMQASGMQLLMHSREVEAFGLIEILPRLPALLRMRSSLARRIYEAGVDIFIGIDASSFNGAIERYLSQHGVACVHYVCPTVWAWRAKRAAFFAKVTKLVLCLYPVETMFIHNAGGKAVYVGHPLADAIALDNPHQQARERLALAYWIAGRKVIGICAGSRKSEIARTLPIYGKAITLLQQQGIAIAVVISAVDSHMQACIERLVDQFFQTSDYQIVVGKTTDVIAASDMMVATSGTVTLETMLIKRPMVICYKANSLSYWLWKFLTRNTMHSSQRGLISGTIIPRSSQNRQPLIGLPNLLAECALVPELIQADLTPSALANICSEMLIADHRQLMARFHQLHRQLRQGTSKRVVDALLPLLTNKMS